MCAAKVNTIFQKQNIQWFIVGARCQMTTVIPDQPKLHHDKQRLSPSGEFCFLHGEEYT